ncbi:DUF4440 domain-containing protein [Prevotella sp. 10(H)]|uniref:YybH family protein n=1 Tax=Prevotella sp. 10(H) TaxID=1158294 RepID=UPI0004A75E55|nr:nuclear transport factor 2 family protein [Prevotella sp. 10(H)]
MKKEDIANHLIALETAALEAWNNGNPDKFLNIYAQDFTYFDPLTEKRMDGFDWIKDFYEGARGKVKVDKYEMINPAVQATENMAVLTYNLISQVGDTIYRWNCTEVYRLEEDNQWKIVHNHWSITESLKK